jgi:hypothetical protein
VAYREGLQSVWQIQVGVLFWPLLFRLFATEIVGIATVQPLESLDPRTLCVQHCVECIILEIMR